MPALCNTLHAIFMHPLYRRPRPLLCCLGCGCTQEELQAQARHAAAQEEAKEAAQRAAEQASAQLREALGQVQVLRAAQLASQSELRAAQEQLYGARRKADGLEEQLQVRSWGLGCCKGQGNDGSRA